MDERLEAIASTLFASGLSYDLIENLESTDDLVHDLLGEERVDQIINIYSLDGEVLAQNFTGTEIPLRFNATERRQTYEVKGRMVRVLNIRSGDLLVQVGMILGPKLFRSNIFNKRLAIFVGCIFVLLLATAYSSSGILFNPLRRLTAELQSMSAQLDHRLGQPLSQFVIGAELSQLSRGGKATKDEFELLCAEIKTFLGKLEDYTKSFHAQAAILTHELKTPLTILKNQLEDLKSASEVAKAKSVGTSALDEMDRLTKLINDYLQWSVLTSNPSAPNEIYAVRLADMAGKMTDELNLIHNKRIQFICDGDVTVFALPDHVRQLLSNLLSNAIKYSPAEQAVICRIGENQLVVEDHGGGIPAMVRAHLGSPFNRGNAQDARHFSSGLGLAWVYSLCAKYNWRLAIDSTPSGTKVSVCFP